MHRHIAFGLHWDSDMPLDQFALAPDDSAPADITVRRAAAPLPEREEVRAMDGASLCADGFRLSGEDAILDFRTPGTIEWLPGPKWQGRFPPLFYGTLAALVLAWRGGAPIHGSSVEIDGRAYLICGESGAGKSTLTAALIASGTARLVADDLSTLEAGEDGQPVIYPGRPAIRLFPATAAYMREAGAEVREDPDNDKQLVFPARADPVLPVPLAATIVIGADTGAIPLWRRSAFLDTQIFRPRWMWAIPGWHDRFKIIHRAGTKLPMLSLGHEAIRDRESFVSRAREALLLIQSHRP